MNVNGGQGTKWRRNIPENFNRLTRAHDRHGQTIDGRAIAYSERVREFTFAKNRLYRVNGVLRSQATVQWFYELNRTMPTVLKRVVHCLQMKLDDPLAQH